MCRQGYKETEIGCIPEDWQVVKLGDVVKVINVQGIKISELQSSGRYPVVSQGENLIDGFVDDGTNVFKYVPVILFGDHTCIVKFVDFPFVPGAGGLKPLKPSIDELDIKYLYYAIDLIKPTQKTYRRHFSLLKQKFIPLPPLHEQKKIAEILSTVDEEIATVDKEIEHAERMKKGLLSKLLTEGIGHTEFKETEIGRIPKEWQVVKLGDVVRVRTKSKTKKVKDIAVITMEDIPAYGEGNIAKYRMIPKDKVKASVYYESGDLLLAKITPSFENGKQAIIPDVPSGWGLATTEVYPLVVKDTDVLDVWFLFYYLRFGKVRKILELEMTGTAGQKRVKKESLLALLLPLPPLHEQKKIAEILSTVDEYIQTLREKKKHLEQVKKGLLNDLITGKRRVKVDATSNI